MPIKTREASAPITAGETGAAADVENEFVKLFDLQNGNIDNSNISASAAIVGTKLAANTIADAQVTASSLTTTSMAISAVTKVSFNSVTTAAAALTASTSFVDVPGISTVTLTPGSTSDIVVMELQITTEPLASAQTSHRFGFNIDDGTGDVDVAIIGVNGLTVQRPQTRVIRHSMLATAASVTVYKPIYRFHAGTASGHLWYDSTGAYNTLFTVTIYPIK